MRREKRPDASLGGIHPREPLARGLMDQVGHSGVDSPLKKNLRDFPQLAKHGEFHQKHIIRTNETLNQPCLPQDIGSDQTE
jgi:hypothetical protein